MNTNISIAFQNIQKKQTENSLASCNQLTSKYGLTLSANDITEIVENNFNALKNTGRVEFSEGISKKLIYAFCDSPYIIQENYKETLMELQDCFYYFKQETMEQISDDELVEVMKIYFDGECEGSVDYLNGTNLEKLCWDIRLGLYDRKK